ncbi:MAG: hypothetical protein WCA46_23390 [Actinocatenispora sp.]
MTARFEGSRLRGEETLRRFVAWSRRMAPGPGLVRLMSVLFGVFGLLVPLAGPMRASVWAYLIVTLLAVVPALRPDSPWVTVVELLMVVEWLIATLLYGEAPSLAGTFAIAVLLYLHHSTCALAAALPASARLSAGVLVRWLGRTGGVLMVSVLLLVVLLVAMPAEGTGRGLSAVPLLGLLAAVGAGVSVAYLLHRRRR